MSGRFPRRCLLMVAGLLRGGFTSPSTISHHLGAPAQPIASRHPKGGGFLFGPLHLLAAGCVECLQHMGARITMRGTFKKTGTRNLSGSENELEEYFAELEAGELDSDQVDGPKNGTSRLSEMEQARRLTAYVTHLRGKGAELPSRGLEQPTALRPERNHRSHRVGRNGGWSRVFGAPIAAGCLS
jgi:hypothetical protein